MNQEKWSEVDHYVTDVLGLTDEALESALRESDAAGLPAIAVSVPQGKFLNQLAQILHARRILEIGTLGGYSTIWMARGLAKGGNLVTIEIDQKHAEVARQNLAHAGLSDRVEVRNAPAIEELPRIADENRGAFDLVFIDADKPSIPDYFAWALKMSRPGSVIVVDNVVREGAVTDAASEDASVQGVRKLNDMLRAEPRVSATVIQTVGTKGYDGFAVILVS
ncbi:MAG: O-methyltransferase [Gemmatimonadaceae bacterium]